MNASMRRFSGDGGWISLSRGAGGVVVLGCLFPRPWWVEDVEIAVRESIVLARCRSRNSKDLDAGRRRGGIRASGNLVPSKLVRRTVFVERLGFALLGDVDVPRVLLVYRVDQGAFRGSQESGVMST